MDFGLGGVDELAEGEVFGLDFIDAELLLQLDIAHDAGFDELEGVDVEGEDALERAGEEEGTDGAVEVGVYGVEN